MAFNCELQKDFSSQQYCKGSVGGLKTIFIANHYAIDWDNVTDTDGVITSMPLLNFPTNRFFIYGLNRQTSSFESSVESNIENGTLYFEQEVTLILNNLTTKKRNEVEVLCRSNTAIICETNAGQYWLFGRKNGCDVSEGKIESGRQFSDRAGFELTFQAMEIEPLWEVDKDVISGITGEHNPPLINFDSVPTSYTSNNPVNIGLSGNITPNDATAITWEIVGTNGYNSGPQAGNLINLTDATKNAVIGSYVYTLTVSYTASGASYTKTRTSTLIVSAPVFGFPTATLVNTPTSYVDKTAVDVVLTGTITPNDGTITSWEINGTNGYSSGGQTGNTINLTDTTQNSTAGTYVYTLTVNYSGGGSGVLTVTSNLTVNTSVFTAPTVTLSNLPTTYASNAAVDVVLSGTITPNSGTITSWTIVGTNGYNSGAQTGNTINLTDTTKTSTVGNYIYTVTVNYTGGGTGTATATSTLDVTAVVVVENAYIGYYWQGVPNQIMPNALITSLNDPTNIGTLPGPAPGEQRYELIDKAGLQALFTITPYQSYNTWVICVPKSYGLSKIYDVAGNDATAGWTKAVGASIYGVTCDIFYTIVGGGLAVDHRMG